MIQFLTSSSTPNYNVALRSVLSEHKTRFPLKIAVAFWGVHAGKLLGTTLKNLDSNKCEFICNLESGATNPELIQSLRDHGVAVKTNRHLHAKVIVTWSQCIVGSANLSANGLGVEGTADELILPPFWEEAGVLTDEPSLLAEINRWFDELWQHPETYEVMDEHILQAKIRRAIKPPPPSGWHYANPLSALETWLDNNHACIAIWHSKKHRPSKSATAKNERERVATGSSTLNFYENWRDLKNRLIVDLKVVDHKQKSKLEITYWKPVDFVKRTSTLQFVCPANDADCPKELRDMWKVLLEAQIDPDKLEAFISDDSNERLITSKDALHELLFNELSEWTLTFPELTNELDTRRGEGGFIYITDGVEGKPSNFLIKGRNATSGFWRNHLTNRPLNWVLVYHKLGNAQGDVWIGKPNGFSGTKGKYVIDLKELKGPLRVDTSFHALTGRKPPENPIYATTS